MVPRRAWVAALAACLVAAVVAPGAARAADDTPEIRAARDALEEARTKATVAAQAYLAAAATLARTEQRIEVLERRIPRLERRVEELRDELAGRAAKLYQHGGAGGLVVVGELLDTNDFTAANRAAHLADVAHADVGERVDELTETMDELEHDRAELDAARAEQRRLVDESRRHTEELAEAVRQANATLRELEQEAALRRYFAAIAAQEAARRAAEEAARGGAPPPPPPQRQRPPADPALAGEIPVDSLVCPVTGVVTFVDDWGQPRSGWRVHQGTDIFAPRGTPNVAVANGVITRRTGGLGGNALWLRADDGHAYYYAHFARFEGTFASDGTRRVVRGEVIGYTGDTGNARGGPTHTHFEIHPRAIGPINPYPLLVDMCAEPSEPPPKPSTTTTTTTRPS